MITPTDLWIAYFGGVAAGLIIPTAMYGIALWRRQRAEEIERRHWREISKFRG